jgi:hypothetical protein
VLDADPAGVGIDLDSTTAALYEYVGDGPTPPPLYFAAGAAGR